MLFLNLAVTLTIGCLICICLDNLNAFTIRPKAVEYASTISVIKQPNQTAINGTFVKPIGLDQVYEQAASAEELPRQDVGLRLFPDHSLFKDPNVSKSELTTGLADFPLPPRLTTNNLNLLAIPQEESEGASLSPRAPGANKEITISVPRFSTDKSGNWVYNPWGVTYGDLWLDTRFQGKGMATFSRLKVNPRGPRTYNPTDIPLSSVCIGKSTLYNVPRVFKWLERLVYNHSYHDRPIWMPLRQEIYKHGQSEDCHVKKMDSWRAYQECALRRNMRMEYMIPKYPLHQIGYRGWFSAVSKFTQNLN